MHVLMLSPGYPAEMPEFTRGLAEVGARVIGVGDQPAAALPEQTRRALSAYIQVQSLFDEPRTVQEVAAELRGRTVDRVESLWEPLMVLAARLRAALGCPGLDVAATVPFRDKEQMKRKLDAAGLRTPHHTEAGDSAGCWAAAERIGYPLIVKPIAGAGSADTYRVDSPDDLRAALPRLRHVPRVSVEEFIDGEEYTFDTITVDGRICYYNIAWYRPRPLIARSHEWISPAVIALRNPDAEDLAGGVRLGRAVLKVLGFGTGFTHMEWYRKSDGEVVFGEIGARPPGAHQVDQMNYVLDFDAFREWARAVVEGRCDIPSERRYNVATIFKRAQGQGRIRAIDGLQAIERRYGAAIVCNALLPVGAARRNWKQTLVSDGFLTVRHPELPAVVAMADDIAANLRLSAG
jgi:biotin carboxylase